MPSVVIRGLLPSDLPAAQALLTSALPYDRSEVVTGEKLLGSNHRRDRFTIGAFSPGGELLGVLAQAGRWLSCWPFCLRCSEKALARPDSSARPKDTSPRRWVL